MADINGWFRSFQRGRLSTPSSSPAFGEESSGSSNDDMTFRIRSAPWMPSYFTGLSKPTTAATSPPDPLLLSARARGSSWRDPDPDEAAETLLTLVMTQGTFTAIPIEFNSSILQVLESYHALKKKLDAMNQKIRELEASNKKATQHFHDLAADWHDKDHEYRVEVRRLEVALAERSGLEAVSNMRSNSVVYHGPRDQRARMTLANGDFYRENNINGESKANIDLNNGQLGPSYDSGKLWMPHGKYSMGTTSSGPGMSWAIDQALNDDIKPASNRRQRNVKGLTLDRTNAHSHNRQSLNAAQAAALADDCGDYFADSSEPLSSNELPLPHPPQNPSNSLNLENSNMSSEERQDQQQWQASQATASPQNPRRFSFVSGDESPMIFPPFEQEVTNSDYLESDDGQLVLPFLQKHVDVGAATRTNIGAPSDPVDEKALALRSHGLDMSLSQPARNQDAPSRETSKSSTKTVIKSLPARNHTQMVSIQSQGMTKAWGPAVAAAQAAVGDISK